MNRIAQTELVGQCRNILGVMRDVMTFAHLRRAAVATAVMGNDAKALVDEIEHLRVPIVCR